MDNKLTKVLLIEDSPEYVLLIRKALAQKRGTLFDVESAGWLSKGLERLAHGGINVVLLDLGLPDSQGLDTVASLHSQVPGVPIVVLTGDDDEALGVSAVREGAQDYLVKGQLDVPLLERSIRYAIERHRLMAEAAERLAEQRQIEERQTAERIQQLEREIDFLEQLSRPPQTAITAETFGLVSMREGVPDIFNQLVQRWGELIDLALEQRAYKMEHNIPESIRAIAEQVGFFRAGPRDVVEIHTEALKTKTQKVPVVRAQAYVEEGRMMVLELMGYLTSFYRNHSVGMTER